MTIDLWPNFDVTVVKPTPKTIVEQAGKGLSEKTKGLVQFSPYGNDITDQTMSLSYSLFASKLRYHYPFLEVRFPVADGYPVELTADKMPDRFRATNEQELLKVLGEIFQRPSTIETIQRLISLSA